ncbi:hypothetical protein [Chitinolyticbacter meiyuanensis]|uniref:hypothetical protein n=1 Tax=Chitinolyticbacter meiyuanensis TaxID=682798 RepID=UPI0011E5A499|nr:hypothetical protein [Chitinolyticbacter meiyuanensis]
MNAALQRGFRAWGMAGRTALVCLGKGLIDACSPGLIWRSACWSVLLAGLCLWAYIHFSKALALASLSAAILWIGGLLLGGSLTLWGAPATSSGSVVAMGQMGAGLLQTAQLAALTALAAGALFVLGYLIAVLLSVRLVAVPLLLRRAMTRLPITPFEHPLTQPTKPRYWVWLGAVLIGLCIPVVAGLLVWAALCYTNVCSLYAAVRRHMQRDGLVLPAPNAHQRRVLLCLGLLFPLLLLVPLLNLLLPAWLCTSVLQAARRAPEPAALSGIQPFDINRQ